MSATLYTTRYCPYCLRAKALLDHRGVDYTEIAVDGNPELRQEMMAKSGRHTVPQIWIGERHIGGCDDLMLLDRSGKLEQMLGAVEAC
ncbi:glutaredoxin 3 [Pseudomaricurvus alkylphenolicus]|uniref:glutaredoxin 3 n=1 Tax=Pseudomaricurvus alkylphenolicus TaxID=1306991 RepID=UPI00141F8543|nr:glutaredoxin 3 [Pseudomaricurvus alkylphenolicus]NIB39669.1 glutaredoxin 3 [Pseudomaricurvus alkylphenolicus]